MKGSETLRCEKPISFYLIILYNFAMSSLEPSTSAKVVFHTTKGDVEIDLWAREAPNLVRRFMQNCIDGKYIGTTFNKVIKEYIIQTSAINDSDGHKYKDEVHSRLKYDKKGIVAATHDGKRNTNSVDSFFITLKPTPEFYKDYVILGKVSSSTIYNVVAIGQTDLKDDTTPFYPAAITNVDVPEKYFDDIEKTIDKTKDVEPPKKKPKKQPKKTSVKLDLEDDDEEDEEHDGAVASFKMKSAHELLNDRKLTDKIIDPGKLPAAPDKTPSPVSEAKEIEPTDASCHEQVEEPVDSIEKPSNGDEPLAQKQSEDTLQESNAKLSSKEREKVIDSDYDSDLDLHTAENIDATVLHNHKYAGKYSKPHV
ncbi:Piso0_005364 [Millerozyma farinosa CBS 7064]|uniref:Piso0_005364 protein n=1 Tax=Pichia sorbitophila (strain ATCC MYA-4447 / BCRC 22081 / CBS 7064 / NBRC 10061 / NRRL Y-12695) TaxID=559304 RepID=G8Y4X1_PICSO|nr:Piso0_005364 [Millerozyma farinosa CBS 7064]